MRIFRDRDVTGLNVAGKAIPIKERAKYLGLRYGPWFSFDSCRMRMELSDVGRKAVLALASAQAGAQPYLGPGLNAAYAVLFAT
jgi:hypothetical protein